MTAIRRRFVDFDARREPKTTCWCCWCQRDLDPATEHLAAYLDGDMHAIHPEDLSTRGVMADDCGWLLIGRDCANKLGLEFTAPQERAAKMPAES